MIGCLIRWADAFMVYTDANEEDPRMSGWRSIKAAMECEVQYQQLMEEMIMEEWSAFYKEGDVLNITNVLEHHIPMREGQRPVNIPQFSMSQVSELRPVLLRFGDSIAEGLLAAAQMGEGRRKPQVDDSTRSIGTSTGGGYEEPV
jgi:hypothetical protein